VRAAQRGSSEAFEELFRRHWATTHRAAYLVVHDAAAAEDIAQEAFLAAIRSLDRFDWRRPLGPWLHRIVVNRAIDWTRARRLRAEVDASVELRASDEPDGADDHDRVVDALRGLGPEQREVVVLRYLLDLDTAATAASLGIAPGTVTAHLHHALAALRRDLAPEETNR
jgi:RNA polymerase sigma-70 factor, ECF subfamily